MLEKWSVEPRSSKFWSAAARTFSSMVEYAWREASVCVWTSQLMRTIWDLPPKLVVCRVHCSHERRRCRCSVSLYVLGSRRTGGEPTATNISPNDLLIYNIEVATTAETRSARTQIGYGFGFGPKPISAICDSRKSLTWCFITLDRVGPQGANPNRVLAGASRLVLAYW